MPEAPLKAGDVVYINEQVKATVVLASPNGRSVVLEFEAVVETPSGFYVGTMPALQLPDGRWVELGSYEINIKREQ
jgi:hypothetical protein